MNGQNSVNGKESDDGGSQSDEQARDQPAFSKVLQKTKMATFRAKLEALPQTARIRSRLRALRGLQSEAGSSLDDSNDDNNNVEAQTIDNGAAVSGEEKETDGASASVGNGGPSDGGESQKDGVEETGRNDAEDSIEWDLPDISELPVHNGSNDNDDLSNSISGQDAGSSGEEDDSADDLLLMNKKRARVGHGDHVDRYETPTEVARSRSEWTRWREFRCPCSAG